MNESHACKRITEHVWKMEDQDLFFWQMPKMGIIATTHQLVPITDNLAVRALSEILKQAENSIDLLLTPKRETAQEFDPKDAVDKMHRPLYRLLLCKIGYGSDSVAKQILSGVQVLLETGDSDRCIEEWQK